MLGRPQRSAEVDQRRMPDGKNRPGIANAAGPGKDPRQPPPGEPFVHHCLSVSPHPKIAGSIATVLPSADWTKTASTRAARIRGRRKVERPVEQRFGPAVSDRNQARFRCGESGGVGRRRRRNRRAGLAPTNARMQGAMDGCGSLIVSRTFRRKPSRGLGAIFKR